MGKLYSAPMEGLTGYVWRKAHRRIFGGADKYFTPFVSPNSDLCWQTKEIRDLSQGEQEDLVPQVITNRAEHFIWAAGELREMGFREINLNAGCPSGTVVAKRKGSGLLRDIKELDKLLRDVFSNLQEINISVKTRIGIADLEEWWDILEVYNKYPITELTIHSRVQKEYYKGVAHRDIFLKTLERSTLPIIYNGDISCVDDCALSYGEGAMVGRGLIRDPALFRKIRGGPAADQSEMIQFHELLLEGYKEYMCGDVPLMNRMKEVWTYMADAYENTENELKHMRKAKGIDDFMGAANGILRNCKLK